MTREMQNLLVEMQQAGYCFYVVDTSKEPWTQIDIPRFRIIGE